MVGTETAAFLGMQCKDRVTVVEPRENVAMDLEAGIRDDLKDVLRREYVDIITGASLAGITEEGALIKTEDGEKLLVCDSVVLAIGTCSYVPLYDQIKDLTEIEIVGDARKARQAIQASQEGFRAGYYA